MTNAVPQLLAVLFLLLVFPSRILALPWQEKSSRSPRLVSTSFGIPGRNATFDYVVVGGGTAGLAIANRLAQKFSVAVIEAGSYYEISNGNLSDVPAYSSAYKNQERFLTDWNFYTQPEQGLHNRKLKYARGRCLGGSSGINNMVYMRPTKQSFDVWADLAGDRSWKWDQVLPFYKQSASFTPPQLDKFEAEEPIWYSKDAYSPNGQPLKISFAHYQQPATIHVAKGFESIGIQKIQGPSSGELRGWGFPAVTIDPKLATRSSSETSFLQDALEKTNIQVYQSTVAKRILFDSKTAVGVLAQSKGSIQFDFALFARKEVIVSAGAFQSPQLLMISGVGPSKSLKKLGIEVLADLPGVGQNMQDPPRFVTTYKVNVTTGSMLVNNQSYELDALSQYLHNQSGPLSSFGADILAWEKLPQRNRRNLSAATLDFLDSYPQDWPDIEYVPLSTNTSEIPDDDGQYMSFTFTLGAFKSRGQVSIDSRDSETPPIIAMNYLTSKVDQELAIQAFRRTREWAAASGIAVEEIAPGPSVQSDAQVLEYLRQTGFEFYHASCTCAMGRSNIPQAVVDSRARVYGVRGLRVVDASAFPMLPPGHPQGTVYMFAEKIAVDILHNGG